MMKRIVIHGIILGTIFLTLIPLFFVVVNSFRSNTEVIESFFGVPEKLYTALGWQHGSAAQSEQDGGLFEYYAPAWQIVKKYIANSLLVSLVTSLGVILVGSLTAYVLARYRFRGRNMVYYGIVGSMMVPGVLTLVPGFMLVKWLGLLNSYGALILPYIASGQILAIFIFKEFFESLPEELFEAARMDGAGHFRLYVNLIFPLSMPTFVIVMMINALGTWNNFLWPFIVNTDERYHVIASGLYIMSSTESAAQQATLLAAYVLSTIPLLILLAVGSKAFIQGITGGAIKA